MIKRINGLKLVCSVMNDLMMMTCNFNDLQRKNGWVDSTLQHIWYLFTKITFHELDSLVYTQRITEDGISPITEVVKLNVQLALVNESLQVLGRQV